MAESHRDDRKPEPAPLRPSKPQEAQDVVGDEGGSPSFGSPRRTERERPRPREPVDDGDVAQTTPPTHHAATGGSKSKE